MSEEPARFDTPLAETPSPVGVIRLRFTERIDPEAAGALWALALGEGRRPAPAARTDAQGGDRSAEVGA